MLDHCSEKPFYHIVFLHKACPKGDCIHCSGKLCDTFSLFNSLSEAKKRVFSDILKTLSIFKTATTCYTLLEAASPARFAPSSSVPCTQTPPHRAEPAATAATTLCSPDAQDSSRVKQPPCFLAFLYSDTNVCTLSVTNSRDTFQRSTDEGKKKKFMLLCSYSRQPVLPSAKATPGCKITESQNGRGWKGPLWVI